MSTASLTEARAYIAAMTERLAGEVRAAQTDLQAMLERAAVLPEALLMEHPQHPGDWTVWLEAVPWRTFGHYATREDARRAAARMGFRIGESIPAPHHKEMKA